MSSVRGSNTKPEMTVRRILHSMNYRYRLHKHDLPGSHDIAFASRKKVIFVHGCFWHRHEGCKKTTMPKTRADFWRSKFDRNIQRDREVEDQLERLGWTSYVVWECETKDVERLKTDLQDFLDEQTHLADERDRMSS